MNRRMADMHVTYTDESGAPQSQSFDPEEFEEELFNIDDVVRELINEGADVIVITIQTEEDISLEDDD